MPVPTPAPARRLLPNARRAARRLAAALPAAALAAACFRGTLPAREFYRLRPASAAAPAAAPAPGAPRLPALTVEPYATPGVYAGPGIVYRVGETRYGTYPNREWAVPLGAMLAAITAEQLRALGGGPVEDGAGGGGAHGLVWRGVVREFEEVDRGPQVSAAVRLDARLVRARDDSVLWQGSAKLERPVAAAREMTAVVDGLAEAAAQAVTRLVAEAAPAMRAEAARAVAALAAPRATP